MVPLPLSTIAWPALPPLPLYVPLCNVTLMVIACLEESRQQDWTGLICSKGQSKCHKSFSLLHCSAVLDAVYYRSPARIVLLRLLSRLLSDPEDT
jgi:hypothetical protein